MRSTWQFNRINIICGAIAMLGILQFAVSVVYAISIYPGGYDVANDFLSDLGRTNNAVCASLFNPSLILLGISLVPFFIAMSMTLHEGRMATCTAGILSACGLIGIGATPYDVYLFGHLMALAVWLLSTLVLVASFLVHSRLNRVSFVLLAAATVCVVFASWKYVSAESHSGHVVFQKLLVVFAVVWFGVVFVIVSVGTVRAISSSRKKQHQLARQYIKTIERGHRQ